MNKLWLSAIAATCLLVGSAAHAGDRHSNDHNDYHNSYHHDGDHGSWGHERHDDRNYHRGPHDIYYRQVAYVRPVVYGRPVYYQRPVYYSRPVTYANIYGGSRGLIHGSISVGF